MTIPKHSFNAIQMYGFEIYVKILSEHLAACSTITKIHAIFVIYFFFSDWLNLEFFFFGFPHTSIVLTKADFHSMTQSKPSNMGFVRDNPFSSRCKLNTIYKPVLARKCKLIAEKVKMR